MRIPVISNKQQPTRLPVVGTAFWIFLLNYLHSPTLLKGICYTVLGLWWVLLIVVLNYQEEIEIDFDKVKK